MEAATLEYIRWARGQGVKLNGIEPRILPKKGGMGMAATRDLKPQEIILTVPTSTLRWVDTIPEAVTRKLSHGAKAAEVNSKSKAKINPNTQQAVAATSHHSLSIHGLLAAELATDLYLPTLSPSSSPAAHQAWTDVLPRASVLMPCLPITWPPQLTVLLPAPARTLLNKQRVNFEHDWTAFSQAAKADSSGSWPPLTRITRDEYMHAWMLVNTRTFYFSADRIGGASSDTVGVGDRSGSGGSGSGRAMRTRPLRREDRTVLQPVADLFNHEPEKGDQTAEQNGRDDTDQGKSVCTVVCAPDRFTVYAPPLPPGSSEPFSVVAGEEVAICYGRHSNDKLLVEYGFLPSSPFDDDPASTEKSGLANHWDEISLDEAVLPLLGLREQNVLEQEGFLGEYVMDRRTVCYRTEVALRLLVEGPGEVWRRFLRSEDDESERGIEKERAVRKEVNELLLRVVREYEKKANDNEDKVKGLKAGAWEQREVVRRRWRQVRGMVIGRIRELERERDELGR